MLRWLRPTWHRHARLIRAYLLPSVRPSDEQLLDDFETFREIKRLAAELREAQAEEKNYSRRSGKAKRATGAACRTMRRP